MKKVLTILLTLVMAIGLVALNSNHIKAEDEPTVYNIWYSAEAGAWASDPSLPVSPNTFKKGDILDFDYDDAPSSIVDPYAVTHQLATTQDNYKYVIEHNNVSYTTSGTTFNIVDLDIVPCNGLKYDGTGTTGWLEYDSSGTPGYKNIDANRLGELGIVMNGNTAKFNKSLYCGDQITLMIEHSLDIVLNNDISIVNNSVFTSMLISQSAGNISIDGSKNDAVYSLTLKAGATYALYSLSTSNFKLRNIEFKCESNISGYETVNINNLDLGDDCNITITNKNSNGIALKIVNEPSQTIRDSYDFFGKSDIDIDLYVNTKRNAQSHRYEVNTGTKSNPNWVNAKAIHIIPKLKPSPTPDKSKGEMKFDSTAYGGEGAYVMTIQKGKSSTPAIAHFVGFDNMATTDVYYYDGTTWQAFAGYNVETSADPATNEEKFTKVILLKDYINALPKGLNKFNIVFTDASGGKYNYHIDITVTEDVPYSPGKDESCEKVIGPTWHWNNDKGICEDYGVVGTSTR